MSTFWEHHLSVDRTYKTDSWVTLRFLDSPSLASFQWTPCVNYKSKQAWSDEWSLSPLADLGLISASLKGDSMAHIKMRRPSFTLHQSSSWDGIFATVFSFIRTDPKDQYIWRYVIFISVNVYSNYWATYPKKYNLQLSLPFLLSFHSLSLLFSVHIHLCDKKEDPSFPLRVKVTDSHLHGRRDFLPVGRAWVIIC